MGRTLAELAPKYAGRVLFVKCNVEVAIETATEYGVRGLPHIGVIIGGKAVDTRLGFQSRAALEKLIAEHTGPTAP
jgi:thioredoxin-like negative regulator of GroEL